MNKCPSGYTLEIIILVGIGLTDRPRGVMPLLVPPPFLRPYIHSDAAWFRGHTFITLAHKGT